ncbi:hypothetical protein E1287_17320 [Actinomadura sp. KC06]|nr:hypothetical protein E1287_17320 [Actinomadura sp. KC06]
MIPGLLQTRAYTDAALESIRVEKRVEIADVAEAVAERMDRQRVLRRPDAQFVFVLEEQFLHHRVVPDVQAEQLQQTADRGTVAIGVAGDHSAGRRPCR